MSAVVGRAAFLSERAKDMWGWISGPYDVLAFASRAMITMEVEIFWSRAFL